MNLTVSRYEKKDSLLGIVLADIKMVNSMDKKKREKKEKEMVNSMDKKKRRKKRWLIVAVVALNLL